MTIQLFFLNEILYSVQKELLCTHKRKKKYMFFKSCEDWVTIHSFFFTQKAKSIFQSGVLC